MIESKGHKITPIDGDLAVSRNAEIGGDADIHGKARVAGSMKVEGFLDAPHIKGAAKGLFNSVEELTREYPNPRPGWFAIVLDATNKEKGILYKAENRGWVATTDEAKPYEFIKDSINVFASKGELADETQRAQGAENILTQRIVNETVRATKAENEIKKNAVKFNRIGITGYADKLELMAATIDGDAEHYIDIPGATETKAGVVSAEDKKKFVKSITWNNDTDPSNMNDFVVAGVYDIKGEHTRVDDNLPVLNTGGGHSFNARLTVLDSSISGSGEDDDKCITQVLSFSNRLGQGEVYIRTGKGASLDNLTWEKWSTLQRNVNVGEVGSLDDLKDNGIYSGVWLFGSLNSYPLTFVCIVINDYFIGIAPRRISQFVYGLSKFDGSVVYQSRVWDDSKDKWSDWEILNQKEISSMIKSSVDNAIKGIIADAPEAFDTLKEIADWIANDETGAVALANAISANTKAINTEVTRAEQAEQTINKKLDEEIERSVAADQDLLRSIDEEARRATEAEEAIVENTDKKIAVEVDKIKDGDTIVGQAREIHSRNGKTVTDSFLARTTAGSGTIGDGMASLKSVGGNIVKNLVDGTFESGWSNQSTVTHSIKNGVCTITSNSAYNGIRHDCQTISNHLYYLSTDIYTPNSACLFEIGGGVSFNINKSTAWQNISTIWNKTTQWWEFIKLATRTNSTSFSLSHFIFIDLTEMFGAGNEPSKEECDKLFGTMDALPQGLNIAKPTTFTSTGFNQFNPDNVLEGKAIANNTIVSGDKKIAVIPCLPCKVGIGENNGYCIHGEFGDDIKVYLTPLNPKDVDGELYMHELTKDATTDTYVPLIKGYMLVEVPTTANLCAHFLWSEDMCERDSYEPYHESKVELPTIPQMSEWGLAGMYINNELVQDVIDLENNKYIKRIGKNAEGFFPLEVQEEYPLPKVDNNYISSDYGVEQFDSVVPCNANNLYYMRSLAGETRNFLDRMYNNTGKSDAKGVADYITNGIEGNKELATNAPNLALRALFVAAGAEYNDTDQILKKTAPWETEETWVKNTDGTYTYSEVPATVEHLPKHYYLNGLGDITEEEMVEIYSNTFQDMHANDITKYYRSQTFCYKFRTNLRSMGDFTGIGRDGKLYLESAFYANAAVEVVVLNFQKIKLDAVGAYNAFIFADSLKHVIGFLKESSTSTNLSIPALRSINLITSRNVNLTKAILIYKRSILYMIQNATPTSAVTITLHPDAYARISNQPDILEALEAQPLVTLVSA